MSDLHRQGVEPAAIGEVDTFLEHDPVERLRCRELVADPVICCRVGAVPGVVLIGPAGGAAGCGRHAVADDLDVARAAAQRGCDLCNDGACGSEVLRRWCGRNRKRLGSRCTPTRGWRKHADLSAACGRYIGRRNRGRQLCSANKCRRSIRPVPSDA